MLFIYFPLAYFLYAFPLKVIDISISKRTYTQWGLIFFEWELLFSKIYLHKVQILWEDHKNLKNSPILFRCYKKLVHVLLYNIFVHYFGMMSQYLNCFCEIYFGANSRHRNMISKKKFHSNLFFFFDSAEKKVNKLLWHHPKIMYENSIQKGHEQVYCSKRLTNNLPNMAASDRQFSCPLGLGVLVN